jgi:hypothetical protein
MEDERFELIESGSTLIKDLLRSIKKPANKESKEQIQESVKLLEKKFKMLKKDEGLRVQYLDRTAIDTIQGVFQAFHLYIISTDSDEFVAPTIDWLRTHENSYDIADRMQKRALARADFNNGNKKK